MYIIDESKKEIERSLRTQKETAKIKNRSITDLTTKPEDFGIKNYDFDSNGFLNVHQLVNLNGFKQTSLPFKFGKVDGGFYCSNSKLTSLKGAPQKVDGDFNCAYNSKGFTREDVMKVCKVGGSIQVLRV